MPPQPGVFAVPYNATHKASNQTRTEYQHELYPQSHHHGGQHPHQHQGNAHASSSRVHDVDARKEKKRKEIAGRLGKEMTDRRDDAQIQDRMKPLLTTSYQLSARPEASSVYNLRLYPFSLERSALLAQYACEERRGLLNVEIAYEEEKMRIEEECRVGKARVRDRLMEGLEERRKKAREEKEGEGTTGDASLDSQSRPHITRKLRNKLGTSPPPTPAGAAPTPHSNGTTTPPILGGPLYNPLTLCVDDIPSPFPLPLISPNPQPTNPYRYSVVFDPYYNNGEDKKKSKSKQQKVISHGLGPAVRIFHSIEIGMDMKVTDRAVAKEHEVDEDLFKLRRGTKRKRGAVHVS